MDTSRLSLTRAAIPTRLILRVQRYPAPEPAPLSTAQCRQRELLHCTDTQSHANTPWSRTTAARQHSGANFFFSPSFIFLPPILWGKVFETFVNELALPVSIAWEDYAVLYVTQLYS